MKKILKAAGAAFSCLLAGALLALTVLVWRPEWFLTPPLIAKAVKTFGASYHPNWRSFEPRIVSTSFARKRLVVRAAGFCFHDSSATVKGCLDSLDADLALQLSARGVYLTRVARMDAVSPSLFLDLARAPPSPKKQKKKSGFHGLPKLLPRFLSRLRIDEMDVRLDSGTIILASTSALSGSLALSYSTGQARPLRLDAQLYYETPVKGENLKASLEVGSDLFSKGALSYLDAVGKLEGDVEDSGWLKARVSQKSEDETTLDASAGLRNGARRLDARLAGSLTPKRYAAELTAALSNPGGALRALSARRCSAAAPLDDQGQPQGLDVSCLLSGQPASYGASPRPRAENVDLQVDLKARLKPRLGRSDYFEGSLRAAVAPRKDWYDFKAAFTAELAGRLGSLPQSLSAKHKLDASLDLGRFEDLVAFLKDTPFAVPAPLNVLQGPLKASLDSVGDTRSPSQKLVYRAAADLAFGRQKLVARAAGSLLAERLFTPQRGFKASVEIALIEVALELPYLKIGTIPAVTVDARIQTGDPKTGPAGPPREAARNSTASAVDYSAKIVTGKPILLFTNINPAPVPIALDLLAGPAGLAGTITVQAFEAELFKKKGSVHHVAMKAAPAARAMELDGLVKFKADEAEIALKLLGSTEKPRVVFESDPPMDQQAIIALLLFNKSPNDLDPDQTASVSNSQSAMANGAFGLASLYLFASTPIQYVGYDPATKTYAMKFSLPGGASLEVGSRADQSRRLTLRKRLARHWVLKTEASSSRQDQRGAVTTFLEWFHRY